MLIIASDSPQVIGHFFVIVGDCADPQQPDRAVRSDPLLRGWRQPGQDRDLHRRHSRRWSGREGWSSETRGPDSPGMVILIINIIVIIIINIIVIRSVLQYHCYQIIKHIVIIIHIIIIVHAGRHFHRLGRLRLGYQNF